jgi:hypothetical protein
MFFLASTGFERKTRTDAAGAFVLLIILSFLTGTEEHVRLAPVMLSHWPLRFISRSDGTDDAFRASFFLLISVA